MVNRILFWGSALLISASITQAYFPAGTKVIFKSRLTPIETIQQGHYLSGQHALKGDNGIYPVTARATQQIDQQILIELANEVIATKPTQRFKVIGQGWVTAEQLNTGDQLVTEYGAIEIQGLELEQNHWVGYQFEIGEAHAYFVGRNRILAHNGIESHCIADLQYYDPETELPQLEYLANLDHKRKYLREVEINTAFPLHPVPRPGTPENHIEHLKQTILRDGYNLKRPITAIQLPNGNTQVIDGNHRLEALKQLGFQRVKMRVIPIKDAEQGKLVLVPEVFSDRIADVHGNKVRYATALMLGQRYGQVNLGDYIPHFQEPHVIPEAKQLLHRWIYELKILGDIAKPLPEDTFWRSKHWH